MQDSSNIITSHSPTMPINVQTHVPDVPAAQKAEEEMGDVQPQGSAPVSEAARMAEAFCASVPTLEKLYRDALQAGHLAEAEHLQAVMRFAQYAAAGQNEHHVEALADMIVTAVASETSTAPTESNFHFDHKRKSDNDRYSVTEVVRRMTGEDRISQVDSSPKVSCNQTEGMEITDGDGYASVEADDPRVQAAVLQSIRDAESDYHRVLEKVMKESEVYSSIYSITTELM